MTTSPTTSALDSQPAPSSPQPQLAYRHPAPWLRFLIPAVGGLVLDLWLKYYSFPNGIADGGLHPAALTPPQPIIPNILSFTTTINRGAVFGIGQGYVWLFLLFSVAALALILWVFATSKRNQWVVQLALGLILSGALGNMYDRAKYAGVRDMLKFNVDWYPYIFNIADVLLCLGVPLLMICWLLPQKEPRR